MKTGAILFTLIFLAFLQPALSQDKLLLRNGDEMLVKVLEITPDSVLYIKWQDSTQVAKVLKLPRPAIFSITYQNGARVVIPEPVIAQPNQWSEAAYFAQGQADARRYHKASGAFWGTFGATVAFPLGGPFTGVPTGLVLGLTRVPERKIIASQPEFKQQPSYVAGYQNQARKKKLGNAAGGFALGTTTLVAVIAIALASFQP